MVFYSRGIAKVSAAPSKTTTTEGTEKMRDDDSFEESYASQEDEDDVLGSSDESSAPPDDYDRSVVIDSNELGPVAPDSPTEGQFDAFELCLPRGELVSPLTNHDSVTGSHLLFDNAPRFPSSSRRRLSNPRRGSNEREKSSRSSSSRDKPQASRRRLKQGVAESSSGSRQQATSSRNLRDPMSSSDHGSRSSRKLNSRGELSSSDHRPIGRTSSNEKMRRVSRNKDSLSQSEHQTHSRSSPDRDVLGKMGELLGVDGQQTNGELAQSHNSSGSKGSSQQRRGESRKPRSARGSFGERSNGKSRNSNSAPKSERNLSRSKSFELRRREDPRRSFRRSGSEDNILSPSRGSEKENGRSSSASPNSRRRRLRQDTDQSNKDAAHSPRRRLKRGNDDAGENDNPSKKSDRESKRQSSLSPTSRRKHLHRQASGQSSEGRSSSLSPQSRRKRFLRGRKSETGTQESFEDTEIPQDDDGSVPHSPQASNERNKGSRRRSKGGKQDIPAEPASAESPTASRRRSKSTDGSRRPRSQSPTARRKSAGLRDGLRRQFSGGGVESTSGSFRRRRRFRREDIQDDDENPQSSKRGADKYSVSEATEKEPVDDIGSEEQDTEESSRQPQTQETATDSDARGGANDVDVPQEETKGKSSKPSFARSLLNKTSSLSNLASKAMSLSKNPKSGVLSTMGNLDEWSSGDESGDDLGPTGDRQSTVPEQSEKVEKPGKAFEVANQALDSKALQSTRRMVVEKSASLSNLASRALIYASAKRTEKKSLLGDCGETDEDHSDEDGDKVASSLEAAKEKDRKASSFGDSFSDLALDSTKGARSGGFSVSLAPVDENTGESTRSENNKCEDESADYEDSEGNSTGNGSEEHNFPMDSTEDSQWEANFAKFEESRSNTTGDQKAPRPSLMRSRSSEGPSLCSDGARPGMLQTKTISSARNIVKNSTSITTLFRYASARKVETRSLLESFSGLDTWEDGDHTPSFSVEEQSDDRRLAPVVEGDDDTDISKWKNVSGGMDLRRNTKKKVEEREADGSNIANEKGASLDSSENAKPASFKWTLLKKKAVGTTEAMKGESSGEPKDSTVFPISGNSEESNSKPSKWTSLRIGNDFNKEGKKKSKKKKEEKGNLQTDDSKTSENASGSTATKPVAQNMEGASVEYKASSKWSALRKGMAAPNQQANPSHSVDDSGEGTKSGEPGKGDTRGESDAKDSIMKSSKWSKLRIGSTFVKESQRKAKSRREERRRRKEERAKTEEGDQMNSDDDKLKRAMEMVASIKRENSAGSIGDEPPEESETNKDSTAVGTSTANSKWNSLKQAATASKENVEGENTVTEDTKPGGASKWSKLRQGVSDTASKESNADQGMDITKTSARGSYSLSKQKSAPALGRNSTDNWSKLRHTENFISNTRSQARESRRRRHRDKDDEVNSEAPRDGEARSSRSSRRESRPAETKSNDESQTSEQPESVSQPRSKWEGLKGKIDISKTGTSAVDPDSTENAGASSRSSKWAGLKGKMDATNSSGTAPSSALRGTSSRSLSSKKWDALRGGTDFINETKRRARASERRRRRREGSDAADEPSEGGAPPSETDKENNSEDRRIRRQTERTNDSNSPNCVGPGVTKMSGEDASKWTELDITKLTADGLDDSKDCTAPTAVPTASKSKWAVLRMTGELEASSDEQPAKESAPTIKQEQPQSKWAAIKSGQLDVSKLAAEESSATSPKPTKVRTKWSALRGGLDFINRSKSQADENRKKERRLRRKERKNESAD